MKKIKTYPSGLRFVVEILNNFPSVVCSIRVGTGSINDVDFKPGISHFIEHMMFKGTKTKNATEIACYFEEFGAEINAYTSQSFTNYYAKCIGEDVDPVFGELCDLIKNSQFNEEEMEREKQVVIEEIAMEEDEPVSVVSNLLGHNIYTSPALQNDILGTPETVKSITRNDILNYIKKYYTANNIVVSFSGKINFEEAEQLLYKYFSEYINAEEKEPHIFSKGHDVLCFDKRVIKKDKKLEQAHVMIAYEMEGTYSKHFEAYNVLSKIIGGSMSSRLFQAVREKLGLVYSIFTMNVLIPSSGLFVIYFATLPENVDKAIVAIDEVIKDILENGVTEQEIQKVKKLSYNEIIMSREKLTTINSKIAKDLFVFGKEKKDSTVIKRLNLVSSEELQKIAKKIFSGKRLICAVGDNVSQQIKTK